MSDQEIEHGTYAGYQKHKRRGGAVCDDCRQANNAYHRELSALNTPGRKRAKIRQQARTEAALIVAARYASEFDDEIAERLRVRGYDEIEVKPRGGKPWASQDSAA